MDAPHQQFVIELMSSAHRAVVRSPRATLAVCAAVVLAGVVGLVSCSGPQRGGDRVAAALRMDDEPEIRVRIRNDAERAAVQGGARLIVRDNETGSADFVTAPLRVRCVGGAIEIIDAGGHKHRFPKYRSVDIAPVVLGDADQTPEINIDGVIYPGFAVAMPDDDRADRFDLFAVMPIEDYVPGVIAKELYPNWPLETFKAQAVAARSYALHERSRSRMRGRKFDVESNTQDQVFGGATSNRTALRASGETRGVVLVYEGKLLRAYYSSTTGGRAASAADTWPTGRGWEFNTVAPIQATPRVHACEQSPLYRWEVQRNVDELGERIRAWGRYANDPVKKLGRIASFKVAQTNSVGRPSTFNVSDRDGKRYVLSAEELRIACNTSVKGLGDITRSTRVNSGDLVLSLRGETAIITGRGFGHGVGLCQYSAQALAEQGWTYKQILDNFYPGARLAQLYD